MKIESQTLNSIFTNIDEQGISNDPYFLSIIKSLIEYIDGGNIGGIKLSYRNGRDVYFVNNGKSYPAEISFVRGIERFIRLGYTKEEALTHAKIEAIQKCFKLKTGGIVKQNECISTNLSEVEKFCNSLRTPEGKINGISIECDFSKGKEDPYCFRLKLSINGKKKSTALKIFSRERDFEQSFRLIIIKLCGVYGLSSDDVTESTNILYERYLQEYQKEYNYISKSLGGLKQAA